MILCSLYVYQKKDDQVVDSMPTECSRSEEDDLWPRCTDRGVHPNNTGADTALQGTMDDAIVLKVENEKYVSLYISLTRLLKFIF